MQRLSHGPLLTVTGLLACLSFLPGCTQGLPGPQLLNPQDGVIEGWQAVPGGSVNWDVSTLADMTYAGRCQVKVVGECVPVRRYAEARFHVWEMAPCFSGNTAVRWFVGSTVLRPILIPLDLILTVALWKPFPIASSIFDLDHREVEVEEPLIKRNVVLAGDAQELSRQPCMGMRCELIARTNSIEEETLLAEFSGTTSVDGRWSVDLREVARKPGAAGGIKLEFLVFPENAPTTHRVIVLWPADVQRIAVVR